MDRRSEASYDRHAGHRRAAADALLKLDFKGTQTRELLGQRDLSYNEATAIIGKAIDDTDLKYAHLPNEQIQPMFVQMGMSSNSADLILEMSGALNSGYMKALEPRTAKNPTPTSFETFVEEIFAALRAPAQHRDSPKFLTSFPGVGPRVFRSGHRILFGLKDIWNYRSAINISFSEDG